MQKKTLSFLAFTFLVQIVLPGAISQARAQAEKASYPAMAPLEQYLIRDGVLKSRWLAVLPQHPFRTEPK